eukprot:212068-Alexandrium_andersonii.AAC.1
MLLDMRSCWGRCCHGSVVAGSAQAAGAADDFGTAGGENRWPSSDCRRCRCLFCGGCLAAV